jgi:hypothetical protein
VDGAAFHPLGTGLTGGQSLGVEALTVYNGELIAGGWFTTAGGVAANGIARWNGSTWQPLGSGVNGTVLALAVHNGNLIVGGAFSMAGGVTAYSIATWNGATWQAMQGGMTNHPGQPNSVLALAVFNGEIVAGGQFGWAGGTASNGLARWTGTSWQPFGAGLSPPGSYSTACRALRVFNGELVVGGNFTSVAGVTAANIIRWNGTTWQPLGAGTNAQVSGLTEYNGNLVAGGSFGSAGGLATEKLATWTGSTWIPMTGITSPSQSVTLVTAYAGSLYAGWNADWVPIGGTYAACLARWDGTTWSAVAPGLAANVYALAVAGDWLVVGGSFLLAPGTPANRVAAFDGGSWTALGAGVDNQVRAIAFYNGEVVAGGFFDSAGGFPASRIARFTGGGWLPLGTGVSGYVYALTEYAGALIAAGDFSYAGGLTVNHVAQWNGSAWQPLQNGLDGPVYAACVYNGDLIVGGNFTNAYGVPVNHIARWNGATWGPLGSGLSGTPPYSVQALVVHNGELIAGGNFLTASGVTSNGLARWNGTAWLPLSLPGSSVLALASYENELVASGFLGPVVSSGVSRWNGGSWQPLGAGLDAAVRAFAEYHGALVAGGGFTSAGGVASPYLARWSRPRPFLSFPQPAGGSVAVINRWLIPGHEYFNLYSFDACAGGTGSGPYAGLCFNNVATLLNQAAAPVGTLPFHFVAPATEVTFGPYPGIPAGLTFDAVTVDVTGWVVGCASSVTHFVVN